jgi:hypothetical protein
MPVARQSRFHGILALGTRAPRTSEAGCFPQRKLATLNRSPWMRSPAIGMVCKAQNADGPVARRGFATQQNARERDERAARDLFSVA